MLPFGAVGHLRIRATLATLLATLLATVPCCLSPTLPLPPPDAPTSVTEDTSTTAKPDGTRRWLVRGASTPGSIVLIRNAATGRIFGVEDLNHDGRYTLAVEAETCNVAEVWELFGDVTSERTSFLVAPTVNGEVDDTSCSGE